MAICEICIKIPQLINSLHKIMFFRLNQKILTPMLEIWLLYLIELHCEILYTFRGGNVEIYLKSIFSFRTFLTEMLLPPAHDMEFWGFKMLILLKFDLFISSILYLLCSVLVSSKFRKSFICNFLRFHESMTSMMRIYLLWASANGMLLWKL